MAKFAKFIDGSFVAHEEHASQPDPIAHKKAEWFPVGESIEGATTGWQVIDGHAVQVVAPLPPRRAGSFGEFMGLFTEAEQAAIAGAAMVSVPIKLWYDQAVAANFIDLDSAKVAEGIAALVNAKLLTKARGDAVLAETFA